MVLYIAAALRGSRRIDRGDVRARGAESIACAAVSMELRRERSCVTVPCCWPISDISATCGSCTRCGPGSRRMFQSPAIAFARDRRRRVPGSVVAGKLADRVGRTTITIWSMAISGTCALLIGFAYHSSPAVLAVIAIVWGFAIVADSAQFSACVTELESREHVGTALTLQTSHRISAHHVHHSSGPVDRRANRTAMVVQRAGDRPGAGDRRDGGAAPQAGVAEDRRR